MRTPTTNKIKPEINFNVFPTISPVNNYNHSINYILYNTLNKYVDKNAIFQEKFRKKDMIINFIKIVILI